MQYREIVAVTGLGGLYQLLATKSDGAIVRNLTDKSTKFISARLHNVTPLESIEVYTTGDNVRLHHVFQKMKDNEATVPLVDPQKADNNGIKHYFKSIFPEFDDERVYVSDMKKMLKWYDLLKENELLNFEEQKAAEEEAAKEQIEQGKINEIEEEAQTVTAEEKPVKKARAKKSAETGTEEDGEKPVKKARAKKSAEAGTEEGEAPKKVARKKKTEE